ncbi:MAG TPA: tRNA lysidine(34) synthetase TilS [Actinomycetota bacterium]|nr:tRNA lysidine(34) synthetase TilS [Actinomycetota bacterium]
MSEHPLKGPGLDGPGFDLVAEAAATIKRRKMLLGTGEQKVLVAVSGGPDSVCLLDVLDRLTATFDLSLSVAHVDHGLSDESADVAAHVSSWAAARGFEVHVVKAPELAGPNLQARARDFRYEFFGIVAERLEVDAIATGHTLDDRVETTLARLVHGAGTEGLAGMSPADSRRIRPLIDSRRSETRAYCVERELKFYDDPANQDRRFERVAIRNDVLGPIESRWGEGGVRAIATSADRLAEDASALRRQAETLYESLVKESNDKKSLDRASFDALPRALRRRLLELMVGRVRDRAAAIDEALDAADRWTAGSGKELRFAVASGGEIKLAAGAVEVEPPQAAPSDA